jgi:hypothetical protein
MSVTILHHLGLGDQLVMNGLVRHLIEGDKQVTIIAKRMNKPTVEFMYRDTDKVTVKYVDTTSPREMWQIAGSGDKLALATYGMDDNTWNMLSQNFNWTHVPYLQAKVNPMYMYTKFKVVRDLEREDKLYRKLVDGDYIFVHDAGSNNDNGVTLDTNLPIIRPDMSVDNIFDYLKIIENAKEVHCINSSFAVMVELVGVAKDKRFFHTGVAHTYYKPDIVKTVFTDWTFL